MIGKEFLIDISNKTSYPKVVDKEETDAYITLYLEFEEGSGTYIANVESISSTGKYKVRVVSKLN